MRLGVSLQKTEAFWILRFEIQKQKFFIVHTQHSLLIMDECLVFSDYFLLTTGERNNVDILVSR